MFHIVYSLSTSMTTIWTSTGTLPVWSISSQEYMLIPRNCQVSVIDPETGQLLRQLRGHVRPVISTLIAPLYFASGDIGGVVILWTPSTGEPLIKYTHSTRVSALLFFQSFVVSGSADSVGIWTPSRSLVEKAVKTTSPVVCLGVENDHILVGLANSEILSLQNGKIVSRQKYTGSLFAFIVMDGTLLVALWDPSCVYIERGTKSIPLSFQPLCLAAITNALFCVGGTSGQLCLCSLDSVLATLVSEPSWITASIATGDNRITYGMANGTVKQIRFFDIKPAFAIYKGNAVWSDTHDKLTNGVHAGALIVKCALYECMAVVTFNNECQIFKEGIQISRFNLHPCESIMITALHVISINKTSLTLLSFSGTFVKEWKDLSVSHAKVIDGISGKESILACLDDGRIILLFLNDALLTLFTHSHTPVWAELNRDKSNLAFIDNLSTLYILKIDHREQPVSLEKFPNVASAAFVGNGILMSDSEGIVRLWQNKKLFRQAFTGNIMGATHAYAYLQKDNKITSQKLAYSIRIF